MIEVILLEKIGRLGQIGQVVKVRPGFARNYLLPRKKALRATKDNLAVFESRRSEIEAANAAAREKAAGLSKTLDGRKFVVIRQASEAGHLFGSVTVRDVATLLHDAGFEVERQNIALAMPIKSLGLHKIGMHLHAEVEVTITLNIARTEDEAVVQEKTGAAVKLSTIGEEREEAARKLEEANKALFDAPPPVPAATEEEPKKEE